jgi:hypothetical protein
MIEEFIRMLARINSLKKGQLWREADDLVDGEFQKLIGGTAPAALQMSETELLAKLIQGEPTQVVHHKTLLLTTLLKETGDVAVAQNRLADGQNYYLKGLNLLLEVLARDEGMDLPNFVPTVEAFLTVLPEQQLPLNSQARLMQHYERIGEFGKAEDVLFAMLGIEPNEPMLLDFGITFYQRLKAKSDASLSTGNLPRPELETSLAELESRKAGLAKS